MSILKVQNLKKNYGALEVLKGVDFEMEKGEVYAVIGASGGGKSTLLRLITFLEKAQYGSIEIGGETLVGMDADGKSVYPKENELLKRASKVGLVFQQFNLFPHLNVLKNLTLAPVLAKQDSAKVVERARQILAKVGLSEKALSYPFELSGGQQQRVAIARALMLSPEILCFDEPTSALDPELTGEVLKVIKSLKDDNTTMIIVTHEIMFARDVADKIIFLDNGEIVECGNAHDVVDNPANERTKEFMNAILTKN